MDTPEKLLTIAELSALPDVENCAAENGSSGVYFLWLGEGLQYIGQSRVIETRVGQHYQNYLYGHTRANPVPRIKFDRATMIVLDSRQYYEDERELRKLRRTMLETEAAYVNAYRTPFNAWPHQATHIELSRI